MTKRKPLRDEQWFLGAAERALAGIDKSSTMIGVIDDRGPSGARYEFMLQIGHCLLEGKPLILLNPIGTPMPDKLRAAATIVEEYRADDRDDLERATKRALARLGIVPTN